MCCCDVSLLFGPIGPAFFCIGHRDSRSTSHAHPSTQLAHTMRSLHVAPGVTGPCVCASTCLCFCTLRIVERPLAATSTLASRSEYVNRTRWSGHTSASPAGLRDTALRNAPSTVRLSNVTFYCRRRRAEPRPGSSRVVGSGTAVAGKARLRTPHQSAPGRRTRVNGRRVGTRREQPTTAAREIMIDR